MEATKRVKTARCFCSFLRIYLIKKMGKTRRGIEGFLLELVADLRKKCSFFISSKEP
ncbi:hypothetical protein RV11_GL000081 [Enterococcus phoeniculicola]|nr:hypothetical protein RV11_GL000081 [Enterococcus phoeniculicola]